MYRNKDVEEVVQQSIIKAVLHAILIPIVLVTLTYMVEANNVVLVIVAWYSLTISVYMFSKQKQLTAYYFFNIMKIVFLVMAGFAIMPIIAIVIGKLQI